MGLRRATSIVLAVVGAFVCVLGVVLAVADRSLFDSGEVERTTSRVVADRDVKKLLARELTDRAVALGGFDEYREEINGYVLQALEDERVEVLLTNGVMASHRTLVDGAEEEIEFNPVTLAAQIREPLVEALPFLDDQLPSEEELLRFELFDRSELPALYDVIETVRSAAWWILALGILCIVAALVVGPGRFGIFALAAGTGVAAMFLAATWIQTVSDRAVDGIDDDLSRRVARLAADEYLADLNDVAVGIVIFGIIGVIAGIGGSWIRNTMYPPKPRTVRS